METITKPKRAILCDSCAKLENPPGIRQCLPCRQLKGRLWSARNKDKVRAWTSQWRENNPEKMAVCRKRWAAKARLKDPAKFRAQTIAWDKKNPEKSYIRKRRYKLLHRDTVLKNRREYYSRATYGSFADSHRLLLSLRRTLNQRCAENGGSKDFP